MGRASDLSVLTNRDWVRAGDISTAVQSTALQASPPAFGLAQNQSQVDIDPALALVLNALSRTALL